MLKEQFQEGLHYEKRIMADIRGSKDERKDLTREEGRGSRIAVQMSSKSSYGSGSSKYERFWEGRGRSGGVGGGPVKGRCWWM